MITMEECLPCWCTKSCFILDLVAGDHGTKVDRERQPKAVRKARQGYCFVWKGTRFESWGLHNWLLRNLCQHTAPCYGNYSSYGTRNRVIMYQFILCAVYYALNILGINQLSHFLIAAQKCCNSALVLSCTTEKIERQKAQHPTGCDPINSWLWALRSNNSLYLK